MAWFSPPRRNFDHDNDPNTAHHSITAIIGTLPPVKKTGFIPTASGTDCSFTFDATVGDVTFPQTHTSGDIDHDSKSYTPAITITKRRFKQEGITLTPSGTGYAFTIDTGGTTQSITSDDSIFDPQPGDTDATKTATIEVDLDGDGTDDVSVDITRRRTAHATLAPDFGDPPKNFPPGTSYFGLSRIVVQNSAGITLDPSPFQQVGYTSVSDNTYTFTIQAVASGTYTLYVAGSLNAGDQPLYSVSTVTITVGAATDPPTPPGGNTEPVVPGAPTAVTATADQVANTITIAWTAPDDDGGAAITDYTITQTGQAAATYTATTSPFTTPALAAGTYAFTVSATNTAGTSPASAPAATATIDPDPVAPGAPTAVTATADQANNTITIAWTAPTNNGGAAINGYTITQTGQTTATYTATASPFTTPALTAGDYAFTVSATNTAGTGDPSAATATATIDPDPVAPPEPPLVIPPQPPQEPPDIPAGNMDPPQNTAPPEPKGTLGTIIFNEVANKHYIDYEWIELRNRTYREQNINNWRMSIIRIDETQTPPAISETRLFDFGNKNVWIPAQGVLLLPFTDPSGDPDHPLAGGWNIDTSEAKQIKGVNEQHSARYLVLEDNKTRSLNEDFEAIEGEGLPNDGEYLLVLRSRARARDLGEVNTFIEDIAGYSQKLSDAAQATSFARLLPDRNVELTHNTLAVGEVHYRQKTHIWGVASVNDNRNGGNHANDTAFRNIGWTGIGYKRNAANIPENGGTPGYANNSLISSGQQATEAVIISEIMFNTNYDLPQWIELQNRSQQIGVKLSNWSLFIVNHSKHADGTDYTAGEITREIQLSGRIPPGQTYLIVSHNSRHNTRLPRNRIKNIYVGAGRSILNPHGFRLMLKANTDAPDVTKHQLIDDVGNLPDVPANDPRPNAQSLRAPAWRLPSGVDADDNRVALARRTGIERPGTHKAVWIGADLDPRTHRITDKIDNIYYGRSSDIGSPGATVGSVLPVALSVFRPERLESGEIVIRWVTASETNNAGFHILRSETRQGPFTQLNPRLIAGQGTTSEQTTYVWKDTTAKPHVGYYYQLQDVSLDGEVMMGRTTVLRGNVSAAGKLTTTWSGLKVQF